MTWAASHPNSRGARRAAAVTAPAVFRWPRGLAIVGVAALLVSAWGGLVAYLGPAIAYRANGLPAWDWSLQNGLLHLAPGAVGVVTAIAVLTRARGGHVVSRISLAFLGLVLAVCGAWFVLGPTVWPVIESGQIFTRAQTPLRHLGTLVGYNLGVGLALTLLGGMVMKASLGERELRLAGPNAPATVPPETAATEPSAPVSGPGGSAPVSGAEPSAPVSGPGGSAPVSGPEPSAPGAGRSDPETGATGPSAPVAGTGPIADRTGPAYPTT
jgi:hypothetical protein